MWGWLWCWRLCTSELSLVSTKPWSFHSYSTARDATFSSTSLELRSFVVVWFHSVWSHVCGIKTVCPWLCIVFVCIVCVYDVKHTHVLFNRPWGISLTLIVSIFTVSVVHYTFISTLFSCNRQLNPWNDKYDCGCILKSGMDCLLESHRVVTGTCIPIDYWLLLCHVSDLQQNVSSVTRYWSIHSPPHWPVSTRLSSTACMHLRI